MDHDRILSKVKNINSTFYDEAALWAKLTLRKMMYFICRWTTGATTFLSGADYLIFWKKYVKLLQKDQKEL